MDIKPIPLTRGAVAAIFAGTLLVTASPVLAEELSPSVAPEPQVAEAVAQPQAAEESGAEVERATQDVEAVPSAKQAAEPAPSTSGDVASSAAPSVDKRAEPVPTPEQKREAPQVAAASEGTVAKDAAASGLSLEAADPAGETPAAQDGFSTAEDGTVYYNRDGKRVTDQEVYADGSWYYFDATGAMTTGWKTLGGKTVYYGADGRMRHDEARTEGATESRPEGWYYFDHDTGAVQNDSMLLLPNGGDATRWVYFQNNGLRAAGELLINDDQGHNGWYYFDGDNNGAMVHGFWDLPDGRTVYYDACTGIMQHGEAYVADGSGDGWRHFDEATGDMTREWKYVESNGGKWVYYAPENGVMAHGEAYVTGSGGDGWCYFDDVTGATQYGWKRLSSDGGKLVFYDTVTGRMLHGEAYLSSDGDRSGTRHWYWLNPYSGAVSYGFQDIASGDGTQKRVYYAPTTGWMVYGWRTVDDKRYHFDDVTGAITFGWQTIGSGTYYADPTDGYIVSGERLISTASDGHAAGWYHFNDTDATLDLGWKYFAPQSKWVYYDPNAGGAMVHQNFVQDGVTYLVDATTGAISNASTNGTANSRLRHAMQWMCDVADDPSHGYDQEYRWGERGDYDCSSLVISAFREAGFNTGSASYTGDMRSNFTRNGFRWITDLSQRQAGDILLSETHHTALYLGNNWLVHASANEYRGATGGRPGDQTGREVYERNYYNYPWDGLLRYVG